MFHFSLLGFPVRIHWTFGLLALFVGGGLRAKTPDQWTGVAIAMAVVFVSILVHELGHALAGRRYGARPEISLHGMGGVCYLPGARFSRKQNILVSLAGPAGGFLLAAVSFAVFILFRPEERLVLHALSISLFVNIVWTVLNLLPILPLDGGQVFRDILGPQKIQVARTVGAITAAILCAIALTAGLFIAAIIAGALAYINFQGQPVEGGTIKTPPPPADR